jgi:hypothetical protein
VPGTIASSSEIPHSNVATIVPRRLAPGERIKWSESGTGFDEGFADRLLVEALLVGIGDRV